MMSHQCPCTEANRGNRAKQKSQWEGLMKQFCEKYKEKCKSEERVAAPSQNKRMKFPTGSSYVGAYEDMNMRGYGEYKFPNGVLYRGEFESGMFHGDGDLVYTHGPGDFTVVRGKWVNGTMTDGQVLFCGALEYNNEDWEYCKMPDRRYALEFNEELKPAGLSNITPSQPPREIPPGFHDNGYGFYNHKTGTVYNYHDVLEVVKAASQREQRWTVDNCRLDSIGKVGPRQDFYETWLEPNVVPPTLPEPLVGFMTKNHFQTDLDGPDNPTFYDFPNNDAERPAYKFKPAPK